MDKKINKLIKDISNADDDFYELLVNNTNNLHIDHPSVRSFDKIIQLLLWTKRLKVK